MGVKLSKSIVLGALFVIGLAGASSCSEDVVPQTSNALKNVHQEYVEEQETLDLYPDERPDIKQTNSVETEPGKYPVQE